MELFDPTYSDPLHISSGKPGPFSIICSLPVNLNYSNKLSAKLVFCSGLQMSSIVQIRVVIRL